ncbi:MAG: sel1 repeat family protein [Colwellia sp.]|nr:sel1 repeat family protein [Colwellia sp.]
MIFYRIIKVRYMVLMSTLFISLSSFSVSADDPSNLMSQDLKNAMELFNTIDIDARSRAYELFNKYSSMDSQIIDYYLARYYLNGIGIVADSQKALGLILKNGLLGDSKSKKLYLFSGFEDETIINSILYNEWMDDLKQQGDPDVWVLYFYTQYSKGDLTYEKTLELIEQKLSKNTYLAHYIMSLVYSKTKNNELVAKHIKLASDGDVRNAQYLYAVFLFYQKNLQAEAEKYLLQAAAGGHTEASYWLGKIYFREKENNNTLKLAEKYFLLAAQNNHLLASAKLGQLYIYKFGTSNNDNAEKYLLIAANGGLVPAQYNLALLYKGFYLAQDYKSEFAEKSLLWSKFAMDSGNNKARVLFNEIKRYIKHHNVDQSQEH